MTQPDSITVLSGFDADAERLVAFLGSCELDREIALPGVGAISVKGMRLLSADPKLTGPKPTKYLVFFIGDRGIARVLNGDVSDQQELVAGEDRPAGEEASIYLSWLADFVAAVRRAILRDGGVEVTGFGTFSVKSKPSRPGVNPNTGEPIEIPPRKLLAFKSAPGLTDRLTRARGAN